MYVDVNGVSLYDEKTGESFPLIFSHEFSIDYPSWEPQVAPSRCGRIRPPIPKKSWWRIRPAWPAIVESRAKIQVVEGFV